jgi:D-glycero-alpha-D-manno-heptose-7-phosphate kinase
MMVALIAAGDRLLERPARGVEATARLARDLEAIMMRLPTGTQDHFPALLGGVLAIEYLPGETRVRPLEVDLDGLSRHLLVVYSGQSHFSAATNWQMIRGCLEGDPEVRGLFAGIAEVAGELPSALERADWEEVGRLVGREWSLRRHLADGVSVPAVDSLLSMASSLGAWGGKACGAGGGGCLAIVCPEDRRQAIAEALGGADGTVLEAPPTSFALSVT